jgi:hypothetical protein
LMVRGVVAAAGGITRDARPMTLRRTTRRRDIRTSVGVVRRRVYGMYQREQSPLGFERRNVVSR